MPLEVVGVAGASQQLYAASADVAAAAAGVVDVAGVVGVADANAVHAAGDSLAAFPARALSASEMS